MNEDISETIKICERCGRPIEQAKYKVVCLSYEADIRMPQPEEAKKVCPKCYHDDVVRMRAKYAWISGSNMKRQKKVEK